MSWEVTRPDGPSRKVAFHRVDVPTDDGSWLLQADLSEGGRTKSSQLIRVHDAIADPQRPQGFRDDVARAYDTWTRHAAEGENAHMAVVCENGAGLSGTAITLMHRRSQEQSRASYGEAGAAVPRQELRRAETEYNNECVRTRGSGFARGHDMYLNVDAGRTSDLPRGVQGQRMRTGSAPLESLHRSPFISSERREREAAAAAAAAAAGDGSRRSSVGYGDSGNYSDSYSDSDSDSDTYSDSSSSGSYSVRSASQSGSEPWSLVDDDPLEDEVFEPLSAEEQSFDFVEDASTRPRLDRAASPPPDSPSFRRPSLTSQVPKQTEADGIARQERQVANLPNVPTTPLPALGGDPTIGRARRSSLPNDVVKKLEAERRDIQQRRLDRLRSPPRTPLPVFGGNATAGRARTDAEDLERSLAKSRQDAMQNALRAQAPRSVQTIPVEQGLDESWELLSSLSDVALPEIERLGAASVPKPPATAAAPGARLMARSSSAPQFRAETRPVSDETLTRTASEPDLRFATLPGLDRQLAPAARHLVGGLLGEPVRSTGLGALLQRATGRPPQASLQTRLENDLQPIVAKLRGEHAAQARQKQAGGLAEQEFVVSHLSRHLVEAMAARSDAERLQMFKAIDRGSDDWLDALDRRDELLERLEDVVDMPQAKFARTRDGYRSLDYGIEAVQRANGLLWGATPEGVDDVGGGVKPPVTQPAA
jgi:hypothetical protein